MFRYKISYKTQSTSSTMYVPIGYVTAKNQDDAFTVARRQFVIYRWEALRAELVGEA